ncbi:MAG: hypothetical protein ACYTF7_07660 [Planctomycetota bacterium]|jgi:hypothetical protein
MKRRAIILSALITASTTLTLTGCGSTSTRLGAIRANPAPELHRLALTGAETKNSLATMRATNMRNFRSTLTRALYLDRPSRLTPAPIPY